MFRFSSAHKAIFFEEGEDVLSPIEYAATDLYEGDAGANVPISFELSLRDTEEFGEVSLGDQAWFQFLGLARWHRAKPERRIRGHRAVPSITFEWDAIYDNFRQSWSVGSRID